MSTIQASTLNRAVYQGTHGNLSVAIGQHTCSANAIGDVIELITLPAGCRLTTVMVYSDTGLGDGAGVTISAGSTTLATIADMSATPTSQTVLLALPYNEDEEVVSATITGAAASGDLIVEVFYVYEGTM